MTDHFLANRDHWDELVGIHARSDFYELDRFRQGATTLHSLETEEVGDVTGKSLLHLQCHFGLDTLSWARRGAQVTGIDFSSKGVETARRLALDLDIPAHFICTNIYDLPQVLDEQFDVVFTSYGAISWLPDIRRWAQTASHFVRQGGTFYMAEIHPALCTLEWKPPPAEIHYAYFQGPEPLRWDEDGSYADSKAKLENRVTYDWIHPLGEVVSALIDTGLRIEFLHEFPYCCFGALPGMEKRDDGWWHLAEREGLFPMLYSIRAVKE